jgi:ABC-type polysaccharide/polyol phosphate export permease
MIMSKAAACFVGLGLICIFGVMSFLFPDNSGQLPAILTAITTLTGAYFTVQMINNGVKGMTWNKDMHDAENNKEKKPS